MITTERAIEKLKADLINRFKETGLGFKVMHDENEPVQINLGITIDHASEMDQVIEADGIRFFLDPPLAAMLDDYELDYTDDIPGGFYLKKHETEA